MSREIAMAQISPFRAIRYDHDKCGGDISNLIAPPYDVLNQADKDALLVRSDRNIVAVDLPHLPPKKAGPNEVYLQSAALMDRWLADGTLTREDNPSLYLYHQSFEYAGRVYTRRMFIAGVRLVCFSQGSVLPHEKTFGGPKEDRLALMKATHAQLSPIFGLFSDPTNTVSDAFSQTESVEPDVIATLNGVENRVWIVHDPIVVDPVVKAMRDKTIYIADGHHRYSTALLYRNDLSKTQGESLPEDHPANWIMFVLASMEDPGCLILPYNRAIGQVDTPTLLSAWSAGVRQCDAAEADIILSEDGAEETPVRFTNRDILTSLAPDECDAWRKLDYAYLHRYLIDELLVKKTGKSSPLHYAKSVEAARRAARDNDGVALLMKATPMAILRDVSEAGGLMPQKSTYFHPKLATGLTINPLQ